MNTGHVKRVVFKFGTNILRNDEGDISLSRLYSFVEDISRLFKEGKEVERLVGVRDKSELLSYFK